MNNNFSCGERIRELRLQRGFTQERLALTAGITPAYLGQVERGQRNATVAIIENICEAMNVSLADFFSVYSTDNTLDDIELQIVSHVQTLTLSEKECLLRIVKSILELRDCSRIPVLEMEVPSVSE